MVKWRVGNTPEPSLLPSNHKLHSATSERGPQETGFNSNGAKSGWKAAIKYSTARKKQLRPSPGGFEC